MENIILHLDMNSYFASVIQQDNPKYRGRPLGVCEHLGGIIIGPSKEAKRWGVATGMPVWEAKKLYPKIILTRAAAERFRFYTRRLIKLVSDYTGKVEVYSIDEVFLDITASCNVKFPISSFKFPNNFQNSNFQFSKTEIPNFIAAKPSGWLFADPWQEAVKIALEIKKRMKTEVGDWLTCSIGVAGNRVLAKIGSDLKKPDGLVVISNDKRQISNQILSPELEILNLCKADLYHRLRLADVPGIGSRQEKNLNALGIRTLRDLKNCPQSHLSARFGRIAGHHLYHLGQLDSAWSAGANQNNDIKSMGHTYTLPKSYRKPEFFAPVLYQLCEMVGRRLRRKNLEGNVLHFYSRDQNYRDFGGSEKLGDFLSDGREIFIHASRLFAKFRPLKGSREFKLIGVSVANLRPVMRQLSLFGGRERQARLTAALDKINDKYGKFAILRAPVLAAGEVFRDSVGFGRVKEL